MRMETGKFNEIGNTINSIGATLQSSMHVNTMVKTAHSLITAEFTLHMSRAAMAEPAKFAHVYEWKRVGDPNARLWRYYLRGAGRDRISSFDFKASKTSVPVAPALAAIGVKQNHIFYWKASVLEFGLPVTISPKIAKFLVFLDKGRSGKSAGNSWKRNGVVFSRGPINIPKQGNALMWNAFTNEYLEWFRGPTPHVVIDTQLLPLTMKNIKKQVTVKAAEVTKKKSFSLTPIGLDPSFIVKLQESLRIDYTIAARTRLMLTDDEV